MDLLPENGWLWERFWRFQALFFQPTGMGGWSVNMDAIRTVAVDQGVTDVVEFARRLSILASVVFQPTPEEE